MADVNNIEACKKLMADFDMWILNDDENKWQYVSKTPASLITDLPNKIALMGQFGRLTETEEDGAHVDMHGGTLKAALLNMAEKKGTKAFLKSGDDHINVIFKFIKMTGEETEEDLSMGLKNLDGLKVEFCDNVQARKSPSSPSKK